MTKKLGIYLNKIVGGGTPSRNNNSYWTNDIPWASVKDISSNSRLSNTQEYISNEGLDNSSSNLIPSGKVIIATRMAVGKAVVFDKDVAINQDLKALYPNNNLTDEYLFYLMTFHQKKLELLGTGSTVKGIRLSTIKNLEVFVPHLQEQKKIAQILSTWDDAIEAVEELIDKKKKLKKGLLNKSFSNLSTKKLLDVVNIIMGQSPSSSSYNDLRNGLPFVGGNADIKENETKPRFFTNQITKIAKPDDIILTVRAPVGEIARNKIEACIGRGVCSLRPKLASDSSYIYQALKYKQRKWKAFEQGSTFTAVNSNDIKKFPIPWMDDPSSRVSVAVSLDNIDQEIELLDVKRKLLSKQKKGLMQRLLTGKTRVYEKK